MIRVNVPLQISSGILIFVHGAIIHMHTIYERNCKAGVGYLFAITDRMICALWFAGRKIKSCYSKILLLSYYMEE